MFWSLILFTHDSRFLRTWLFKTNISFILSKIFLLAIPFPVSRGYLFSFTLLFKNPNNNYLSKQVYGPYKTEMLPSVKTINQNMWLGTHPTITITNLTYPKFSGFMLFSRSVITTSIIQANSFLI